jgi:hypothetical protein
MRTAIVTTSTDSNGPGLAAIDQRVPRAAAFADPNALHSLRLVMRLAASPERTIAGSDAGGDGADPRPLHTSLLFAGGFRRAAASISR